MSKYRVFLVRIFSYLDWIRRFTRENTDQKNFVLGQFIRYFLHYEQNFRWDQIKWRAWCYYRIDQVIRGILNTLKIANKELHFRKINIYVIIHIDTKRSFRYCLNTMYCLTKTTPPPPSIGHHCNRFFTTGALGQTHIHACAHVYQLTKSLWCWPGGHVALYQTRHIYYTIYYIYVSNAYCSPHSSLILNTITLSMKLTSY